MSTYSDIKLGRGGHNLDGVVSWSREIVRFPEVRRAVFNKDFYFGFYCTVYKEQAERWATRYGKKGICE